MRSKLFCAALLLLVANRSFAQQPFAVGDKDDQLVITGCVVRAADVRTEGPHSMFIWSDGDVYLSSPDARIKPSATAQPIGTAGRRGPVFYWLDDEDDFAKYVGQRVEIVGELGGHLDDADIEIEHKGTLTELTFDAGSRRATARIPTSWLGPATRGRNVEAEVVVRPVDVEQVTVMGPCAP
jgi:hypothetical protein